MDFNISLPGGAEAPRRTGRAPAVVAPAGGRETLLVAEDEQLVRLLARKILEHAGYAVLVASGPPDALRLAGQHLGPIDLLLTDVVMPEMSGRELVHRLAEQRPEMRVLYMSGYADEAVAQHGVLDPGTAIIPKPLTTAGRARQAPDA